MTKLEKNSGLANKLEIVNVELYCKDCGYIIDSWQEKNGKSGAGRMQINACRKCKSQNIGTRKITL